ncbi:uncharacterized mitochondrial protein AtMg00810-like [Nicotiana sylvestris]|uniref:uncharacterized mitochondrial protein AtMg00810-like n=1 Tax=Nicotiana sylvestris TaxID=4096 RepID=UPI00388CC27D
MTTIRCLLTVAAKKDWNVSQLDVNNAFLHRDLQKEVYMRFPAGDHLAEIQSIKDFLNTKFKVKNLGSINYFLGMVILREQAGFIVSQRKFTLDMLQEFDVSHLPLVSSLLDLALKLQADDGEYLQNPTIFRYLVGKLNYLTNTRLDLSFVVLTLNQYMQKPYVSHFSAALRVLKYLSSDPVQGILLSVEASFSLLAFCDADWASCKDSRRSVSGLITLSFVPSKAQLTDIFTKPLSRVSHREILGKLGVTTNLRGDVEKKKPLHTSDFHGGSSINREEDEMKKKQT